MAHRVAGELAARSIPGTLIAVDHGQGLLRLATGDLGAARAGQATAHAVAAEADRLLAGAGAGRETSPWYPLTARELEVARLVAAGGTNREIAARLFLSPKTVAAHVEHILTKLGAARRTEIAAWVAVLPAAPGPTER